MLFRRPRRVLPWLVRLSNLFQQRLWRSGTRLLAGYRAGYALHQLHLPLGSEGGAFGDLFNAAFADYPVNRRLRN